jgi:hypothetical protein
VPSRFACDGQTGTVIFEEKFTGDSGGWVFGADDGLVAPGATLTVGAGEEGRSEKQLNETFNATQGNFCMEMSFPADAPTRISA